MDVSGQHQPGRSILQDIPQLGIPVVTSVRVRRAFAANRRRMRDHDIRPLRIRRQL